MLPADHPDVREIRDILRRRDQQALGGLLAQFDALVEDCGPLAGLRFEPVGFSACLQAALPAVLASLADSAAASATSLCDALHTRCIATLAPPPVQQRIRQELESFCAASFVPAADRRAALAALLSLGPHPEPLALAAGEQPALYAIFAAQLRNFLREAVA